MRGVAPCEHSSDRTLTVLVLVDTFFFFVIMFRVLRTSKFPFCQLPQSCNKLKGHVQEGKKLCIFLVHFSVCAFLFSVSSFINIISALDSPMFYLCRCTRSMDTCGTSRSRSRWTTGRALSPSLRITSVVSLRSSGRG